MAALKNYAGFTLIEMLVAMAIGVAAMAVAVSFLYSQQRVSVTQQTVVKMQQEMRAAMSLMTSEIRMAGYDPTGGANAGFISGKTNASSIEMTMDLSEDRIIGGDNEHVEYALNGGNLARQTFSIKGDGSGLRDLASNVEALDFVYLDENGTEISDLATGIDRIRAVEITMVARCSQALPGFFVGYTDAHTYTNLRNKILDLDSPSQENPPNDKFRRIALSATVKCRNMGLPAQ